MHILLSNDDGYQSSGIRCLAASLRKHSNVVVVAPDRDRSGASNSLTLDQPIRPREVADGFVCVDGTPTDCVHLALTGLMTHEPDIVISGINAGANLGDDVLYSGTVAAAMEGRFLGLPSIAVSLVLGDGGHYDTAARVVDLLLEHLRANAVPRDTILNVNVPDCEWSALRGIRVTRLGQRHRAEPIVRDADPRGRTIYWIGAPGNEQDAGPGTDFDAVRTGHVSITPLRIDLTREDTLEGLGRWVAEIPLP